jgi:16S rRNA C1402 N4-methylase RsmH
MRFKSSREAMEAVSAPYFSPSGEPLHFRQDGGLDMRFNSSKEAVAMAYPAPDDGLHYNQDGSLDMRYTSSKLAAQS